MAEIINYNPQDNPRLQQIYQILLLAGYFRIRINSLKAFDKVIGGMAWCITSSNFQIQVEYNDQMQIGQKIKVSEHICHALQNMKCPYNLQPFQLQGLDVDNIFPAVQWLIKFVYETRWERQRYNRQIALRQSGRIVQLPEHGNLEAIRWLPPKRVKLNKAVMSTKHHNPIRVYSALLEFDDMTSLKMYNKLHNMMLNKKRVKGQKNDINDASNRQVFNAQNDDQGAEIDLKAVQEGFLQIMNPDKDHQKEISEEINGVSMSMFSEQQMGLSQHFSSVGNGNKISLQKLGRIIEDNKSNFKEAALNRQNDQTANWESPEQVALKRCQQQNSQHEEQVKALQAQLQSMQELLEKNKLEKEVLSERSQQLSSKLQKRVQKHQQIQQYGQEIEEQLRQQKSKTKNMQAKVQKRARLKEKKAQVKKRAKNKLQQLEDRRQRVLASIPEIDSQVFAQMVEEAEMKKRIYDAKYEELTGVNQELAVLQRKAESYTSAPEIAQYHQRFVQLFEAINGLIEQKRSGYGQMENLESIQKLVNNYKQFLINAKDGIEGARKKDEKKQLTQDFKQILKGFEANMNNSRSTLSKLQSAMEKSYKEYTEMVRTEREYLKRLRELKIEYQNAEKFYHSQNM